MENVRLGSIPQINDGLYMCCTVKSSVVTASPGSVCTK